MKALNTKLYCVVRYDLSGNRSIISGAGKHKGTSEYTHSKRAAQRHAKHMREVSAARGEGYTFKVEEL